MNKDKTPLGIIEVPLFMKFSVLTYNLLYNRASKQLKEVLAATKPDLIFFQEMITEEKDLHAIEDSGYKLADFSNSFIRRSGQIFGVATFYNSKIFKAIRSRSFDLPSGFLETLIFIIKKGEIPRTVLETEFEIKDTKKKLIVYNIHLSAAAMNTVRQQQIVNTFHELKLDKKHPIIIAGDFNYPYRRKDFQKLINQQNLKEATKNLSFTSHFLKIRPLKLKLDYILYKNLLSLDTKRVDIKFSDHYPILSIFSLKKKNNNESSKSV